MQLKIVVTVLADHVEDTSSQSPVQWQICHKTRHEVSIYYYQGLGPLMSNFFLLAMVLAFQANVPSILHLSVAIPCPMPLHISIVEMLTKVAYNQLLHLHNWHRPYLRALRFIIFRFLHHRSCYIWPMHPIQSTPLWRSVQVVMRNRQVCPSNQLIYTLLWSSKVYTLFLTLRTLLA